MCPGTECPPFVGTCPMWVPPTPGLWSREPSPLLEAPTCSALPKPAPLVRPLPKSVLERMPFSSHLETLVQVIFLIGPRNPKPRNRGRACPLPLGFSPLVLKPTNNLIYTSDL